MTEATWQLSPDRCFAGDPAQRTVARDLYAAVQSLPLLAPHGHVLPALLADAGARFVNGVVVPVDGGFSAFSGV